MGRTRNGFEPPAAQQRLFEDLILPAGWSQADCDPPGSNTCNMDGFGGRLSEIDNPGGNDLSFSFTLAGLVTSFTENANGAEFVAQVR